MGNNFIQRVPKSGIVPKVVPKTGSAVPFYPNMDQKFERRTMECPKKIFPKNGYLGQYWVKMTQKSSQKGPIFGTLPFLVSK